MLTKFFYFIIYLAGNVSFPKMGWDLLTKIHPGSFFVQTILIFLLLNKSLKITILVKTFINGERLVDTCSKI